jgi:hypothetical protein
MAEPATWHLSSTKGEASLARRRRGLPGGGHYTLEWPFLRSRLCNDPESIARRFDRPTHGGSISRTPEDFGLIDLVSSCATLPQP